MSNDQTQKIGLVLRRDVQTGIDEYTPVYKTVYVEIPDDGNHWQVIGQTEDTFFPEQKGTEDSVALSEDAQAKVILYHRRVKGGKDPLNQDLIYWSNSLGKLCNGKSLTTPPKRTAACLPYFMGG